MANAASAGWPILLPTAQPHIWSGGAGGGHALVALAGQRQDQKFGECIHH